MKKRKYKFSYKIFPFAPGVKWTIVNDLVRPRLPLSVLTSKLKENNVTVMSHGGLVESFYSFIVLEMLNYFCPSSKLYWGGNEKYKDLLNINGLARFYEGDITPKILKRYPLPLFFDKNNNAYFNFLNNYSEVKSIKMKLLYRDRKSLAHQLVRNTVFKMNRAYWPKLRRLDTYKINDLLKAKKVDTNKQFVLFIPDTGESIHNADCLGWSHNELKSFAALLKNAKIPLIILTNKPSKYFNIGQILPLKLDLFLYLVQKTYCLMATEIDYLLIGIILSNTKTIAKRFQHKYSLKTSLKRLYRKNDIYTNWELSPVEASKFVIGE